MSKDFYRHGDHNAICDRCGRKVKFSELKKEWDGLWVCKRHWEIRHPQDFLRGLPDNQSVPVTRPESADSFVTTLCSTRVAVAGVAIAGCAIASYTI